MKTQAQAFELAQSLVETGQRMGVCTTALLTDMNQPLGRMCGNAVEVNESVDVLKGTEFSDDVVFQPLESLLGVQSKNVAVYIDFENIANFDGP